MPTYSTWTTGPAHDLSFHAKVVVQGAEHVNSVFNATRAERYTSKKLAEQSAAAAAVEALNAPWPEKPGEQPGKPAAPKLAAKREHAETASADAVPPPGDAGLGPPSPKRIRGAPSKAPLPLKAGNEPLSPQAGRATRTLEVSTNWRPCPKMSVTVTNDIRVAEQVRSSSAPAVCYRALAPSRVSSAAAAAPPDWPPPALARARRTTQQHTLTTL
jgi:hypothetical protein